MKRQKPKRAAIRINNGRKSKKTIKKKIKKRMIRKIFKRKKRITGIRRLWRKKKKKMAAPVKQMIQAHEPQAPALLAGMNLIGFSRAEMGIGEAFRQVVKAVQSADIPFGIVHYSGAGAHRNNDTTWIHRETTETPYQVNLVHMNPDSLMHCHPYYKNGMFESRFTIGYWVWELQEFPESWYSAFPLVNEVWVPSTFILDSVTRVSKLPVVRIPHPIDMPLPVPVDRSGFGLPKDRFLFLVMFDAHSMQDRKNPIGAIDAFLKAFGPENSSVGLVIKAYNIAAFPEEKEKLVSKIEGRSNIYLLEDTMNKQRVNTLIHSTDAFISLHRSEGFGLVMAEAMYLGKPVLATHWSGNTDFMNAKNSCPVQYELVQIGKDIGPYKAHQIWAEPDLEHAAYSMRELVLDHKWRSAIAARGQQTIHQTLSPKAVGGLIRQRLSRLQLL